MMRSSRPFVRAALAAALILTAAGVAFAAAPLGISRADELAPQSAIQLVAAPPVDLEAVTAEDAQRSAAGLAPRFAIPEPVEVTPATHGSWERLADGTEVWRLRVGSPGAVSLNLGFSAFHLPAGAVLQLYGADHDAVVRPITDAQNAPHGEFWSPVIPSDEIVVEVDVPAGRRDELVLTLSSIDVGYRGFLPGDTTRSGACNVDVVCPEGDAWRDEIPAVAVISTGGSLFCTGFMVNNSAQDQTPYFMTAYHCGISGSNAASLVAYWNYETSSCGGPRDGSLADWQSGSTFRARSSASDFTLVELDRPPEASWGVTYAGWSRSSSDATSATGIHHPNTDEKAISFELQATSTTSYLGTAVPGDGTHVRITDWDVGTTEPGSSGSPLFDQNHHVIGQLHGGYAACSNNSSDWYGRFSVSWNGGGTASTRLRDWLDPLGTNPVSVDTLVPGGCTNDGDCDDGLFCNGAETCGAGGSCQGGADPCPGQDCDEGSDSCVTPVCNGNGTCEGDEDCSNCPSDCVSGSAGAICGNGVCETGAGEDCLSCSADCNGKTNGPPSGRYCCGSDVGCGDNRCSGGGNTCSTGGGGTSYCCGDAVCQGAEDSFNCALDCGAAPACGDGTCDGGSGETQCTCSADCGTPPSTESGGACSDGIDNDCDGFTDAVDPDCGGGSCAAVGDSCSTDADCCSSKCRGPSGRMTCK